MKIKTLFAILISLSFYSCKKTGAGPESPELHSVSFSLDGFSREIVDCKDAGFLSTDSSPQDNIHFLSYYIYDSGGGLVSTGKQTDGSESFGIITEHLKSGDYTAVFIGSLKDASVLSQSTLSSAKLLCTAADEDLFFKKVKITVSGADLSESVMLERIVAFLEIHLKEVLPSTIAKVDFTLLNDYPNFLFSSENVTGTVTEKKVTKVVTTDEERSNVSLGMCVLNDAVLLNTTVTCYDADNKPLKSAKIQNVQCVKNKKTILSGKIFTDPTGKFAVSVNGEWDSQPIEISF